MTISSDKCAHRDLEDQKHRACSKKFVQQGHSQFCARSVPFVREHGKMARTPLAAFFNRPMDGGSGLGGVMMSMKRLG